MSNAFSELPVPEHFDPAQAFQADFSVKDIAALKQAAEDFARKHSLRPYLEDKITVHLLIIDAQVDFSFPEGALFVAGRSGKGAMEANQRLARFIYRYLHVITRITCTLDTHNPLQIFFPSAHLRADGTHPKPHTVITAQEYRRGLYKPSAEICSELRAVSYTHLTLPTKA